MNPTVLDQIVRQQEEIESLRQQLAAALAAIKVKDDAIQHIIAGALSLPRFAEQEAKAALAIQPDDSALKAWLGELVAWMFQHEDTGRTMCVEAQQVEWNFEKLNPRLFKVGPLYAPKGMK